MFYSKFKTPRRKILRQVCSDVDIVHNVRLQTVAKFIMTISPEFKTFKYILFV